MFYVSRLFEMLHTWRTQLLILAAILLAQVCLLALARRFGSVTFPRRFLLAVTAFATVSTAAVGAYAWYQANTLALRFPFIRLPDGAVQYVDPAGIAFLKVAVAIHLLGATALILLNIVLLALIGWAELRQRLRPIQPAS